SSTQGQGPQGQGPLCVEFACSPRVCVGIHLRPYQLHGVQWLCGCLKHLEGCILGDEMGLGKTCQTISLLVYAQGCLGMKGPFLVLCPLSVLENWRQELERFCPSLSVVCYTGDKERRVELQREMMGNKDFHVLLTTYEMCLKDASDLRRWKWDILVVDEAHRLKNQESLLHQTLSEFSVGFRVLLTGTPIQNKLQEVYSLLSFIQPSLFPCDATEEFVSTYSKISLHEHTLQFRITKFWCDINYIRYTPLYYIHAFKCIFISDAFGSDQGNKTRLLNILVQLRKCVNHPYLFDGVEPEPFEMGEHLVEASGKLSLLDTMLAYLLVGGHRVLLFSQMTRMLDILQDYLEYRGYSYERLDGSVRGEERNLAIKNFSTKDVFIFLLSTRAGGVGMNLTAADTVIFVDSDFNPQNDLQAAARAHRIGQTRAVKVIRLLGRDTVEEIIYSRAVSKLRLTSTVIEEGRFSLLEQPQACVFPCLQLSEILKFGVDKLLLTEESSIQNVDLKLILGPSRKGHWLMDEEIVRPDKEDEDEGQHHMYYFEGRDYSKDPSTEDQKTFELLLEEQLAQLEDTSKEGRTLRHKTGIVLSGPLATPARRKRPLTESELEQRRQKRQEAATKRAKLQEEKRRQREEQKYKKKMEWWASCGYKSLCLPSADSEGEDVDEDEDEGDDSSVNSADSDHTAICYILGDVTHPQADREDAIIVHCVDDAGRWGRGGLFTALEVRSDEAKKQYELAGDMEDLDLGNVLLFPIDDKQSRLRGRDHLALIIAQQRDKANNPSGIRLTALEEGLKKIYRAAKQKKASVHLPRIGHSTKGFNWYGTERLIRKHLASRGIPTFIYYYKRTASHSTIKASSTSTAGSSTSCSGPSTSAQGEEPFGLSDFMRGVRVFFYNMGATEKKKLARYLDIMNSQVTHVVAEVDSPVHMQELQDLMKQYPKALLVKKKWLESCFANQRKVNTSKYVHHLK
uniref:Chromodomain-helicase-DNA-binding protein 1-like n=1 Tax=Pygocentrus nattereri TaxID=42514 RepID=A0AAR2K130_PYGNA